MLKKGLTLSPPKHLFWLITDVNPHTKLLPNSLNKKSLTRCILLVALLTNLKSPQSSGVKFGRNSGVLLTIKFGVTGQVKITVYLSSMCVVSLKYYLCLFFHIAL
jgi:hypothetical protein